MEGLAPDIVARLKAALPQWLVGIGKGERLLFILQSASIDMFSLAPIITTHFYVLKNDQVAKRGDYTRDLNDEIYIENKQCFRTNDRYIRKKILKNHRSCITTLQELKKRIQGNFLRFVHMRMPMYFGGIRCCKRIIFTAW